MDRQSVHRIWVTWKKVLLSGILGHQNGTILLDLLVRGKQLHKSDAVKLELFILYPNMIVAIPT